MLTDGDVSLSQRINSSLNDSSTKQAYSFGKAIRFKPNLKKDSFYKFYNLPEIRSHRGTSLGYGKKATSSLVGCGSNQLYAAPSYFDPKQHNAPVYSFGVSRPKGHKRDTGPGPIYDVVNKFGKGVPGFVFGTSGLKKSQRLNRSSSMPGPGTYYNEANHKIGVNYNNNSKLIYSGNTIIGKEKRFIGNNGKENTPGPGAYNIPGLINDTGMINFNSKYASIPARSFLGKRNFYKIKKVDTSPGLGQYNFFSIFEGYSNINKK